MPITDRARPARSSPTCSATPAARPRTDDELLDEIAEIFGFDVEELKGKSRQRPLVTARQIAHVRVPRAHRPQLPGIARLFGGRDHTTVIHAVEKIQQLMSERKQIYDQVTDLHPAAQVMTRRVGSVDGLRTSCGQHRRTRPVDNRRVVHRMTSL